MNFHPEILSATFGPGRAIKSVRNFTVPGPVGEIACRLYSVTTSGTRDVCKVLRGAFAEDPA